MDSSFLDDRLARDQQRLRLSCQHRAGKCDQGRDLAQVEVGMTKNQVRFLLGTPMIDDPFNKERWDYVYYLKLGRDNAQFRRWVSVFFEDDLVSEIRRDQELAPDI